MTQANDHSYISTPATANPVEVIDMETGEVMTAAEANRRAAMRRLWAAHNQDGSAI